jgi:hypothetical protein
MSEKIKLLKTKTLPISNDHYTHPFTQGEVVQYMGVLSRKAASPETYRKQLVRIYRPKHKEHMVEILKNFTILGSWVIDWDKDIKKEKDE